MIDKSWIGRDLGDSVLPIEAGRLKFFAKAIGETNPIYLDEAAARDAGYAALPAPPTFLFAASLDSGVVFRMLEDMRVPIGKVLHGEQSFEYRAAIVAGDLITVSSKVSNIYEKKNGALEFVELLQDAKNQNGLVVAQIRNVTVVRN